MESIGEKLRTTREEKSLSIDQVARDTNIAKRYIVALEDEAFAEFPGEPYLIGFLRNYSDYLGLDSEEIVNLYKNFKIQEQPVPMEELLETKRNPPNLRVFIIIAVVVAVGVLAYLLYPLVASGRGGGPVEAKKTTGTEYTLKDEIIEQRFVSGDSVVVPVGDKSYQIKLQVNGSTLALSYPGGQQTLKLGEEKSIDLNGDNVPDVKVFLRDVDTRDPNKAVVVRFDRFTQSPQGAPNAAGGGQPGQTGAQPGSPPAGGQQPAPQGGQPSGDTTGGAGAAPTTAAAGTTAAPAAASAASAPAAAAPVTPAAPAAVQQGSTGLATPAITPVDSIAQSNGTFVVMQSAAAAPFTVTFDFNNACLFRYLVDGQNEQQRYFHKGDTTRLDVTDNISLWASNAGALSARIAGRSISLGNPGEVAAQQIKWVKNGDSGSYQLELTSLD